MEDSTTRPYVLNELAAIHDRVSDLERKRMEILEVVAELRRKSRELALSDPGYAAYVARVGEYRAAHIVVFWILSDALACVEDNLVEATVPDEKPRLLLHRQVLKETLGLDQGSASDQEEPESPFDAPGTYVL